MGVFFEFDRVESFTVGTVGRPGHRVFLLQVRADNQRVIVKCEKQQAVAIAQYLRKVLNDLPPPPDRPMQEAMELVGDLQPSFALGPIGLGYDQQNDRMLVQLEELLPTNDDGDIDPEAAADRGHVRLYLSRGQAVAFCEHADQVAAAGRPTCVWCGGPVDPDGHPCPRMN
jgi:uncharacterized repeat protein (TIGR03847 family)